MESSPRPGYYPDPSVPGYIRYWDGSRWVPGTSKPMPEGVGAAGSEAEAKAPSSLAEVNFDDLLPELEPEPSFSPRPSIPEAPERQAPAFPVPPSMADVNFDKPSPVPPPAPAPAHQPAPSPAPRFPAPQVASDSGMGSFLPGGPAGESAPPTPAQVAATSQSLRIRLLRPDGKPFDGPEITTGPKDADPANSPARNAFDAAQRGPKKQAPKVVVKTGPAERLGHTLAVLAISALGIVPLAYLLLQSVHDREDKLAAKITAPTKMNVLDGTSDAYLAAMAVVLAVVGLVYWTRLKRRRTR
ncbi:DUF2510 domain-containing protein [Catenulispora yoronensis]|uniref:DUF2510 domain-containing protein n=1 Tax=Catenulispora yoronensis TaxID=450799 RepID=UPI0031DBCADD